MFLGRQAAILQVPVVLQAPVEPRCTGTAVSTEAMQSNSKPLRGQALYTFQHSPLCCCAAACSLSIDHSSAVWVLAALAAARLTLMH